MAIVKMNKFTLLTFESKKEELLRKLQGFSNVEFINLQDENLLEANEELKSLSKDEIDSNIAKYEEDLSKAKTTLDFLTNYMPKKSGLKALEDDKEDLTIDELDSAVKNINWNEIYEKVIIHYFYLFLTLRLCTERDSGRHNKEPASRKERADSLFSKREQAYGP
jgi:V/A-type H+-transporting ATPase subunit I